MPLNFLPIVLGLMLVCTSVAATRADDVLDRALLKAVEEHDRAKVADLLKQGANINAKGINLTVLQTAIFEADVEIVKLLLEKGARINETDLAEASRGVQGDNEKSTAIVKLLISSGADVRINGIDALAEAAGVNNLELVNLFLSKGVNPNGKTKDGKTVLFEVVPRDCITAIETLLAAGADAKVIDSENDETLLMRAARADHRSNPAIRVAILKALLNHGANIRARDRERMTALHYSVQQYMSEAGGVLSRPEIVRFLLEQGADVNAKDNSGDTPLMVTMEVWRGPIEVPQLLIDQGADVNVANNKGETALMLAARAGRNDLTELLLDKGARLDTKDSLGNTALVYAVEAGMPETVTFLANKGADLKATPYKTEAGLKLALHNFALLRAVTRHEVEDVKKFLAVGADPNFRNREGHTSLLIAVGDSYGTDIVKLLLEKNADVNVTDNLGNTPLMWAVSGNGSEVVPLLIAHKASVNVKNKQQETALLIAARQGHSHVLEMLLESGADVRVRDKDGLTALLLASQSTHAQEAVVELLLAKGAEPNVTDSEGRTALMLGARMGSFQIIDALVAGGVDVGLKDKKGWTALRYAKETREPWTTLQYAEYQRAEVVKRLEHAGARE